MFGKLFAARGGSSIKATQNATTAKDITQTRYASLRKRLAKFCGMYSVITKIHESGLAVLAAIEFSRGF